MGNLKIQKQLHRINAAYQQCMDEMQAHGMDTNAFVVLQIERFALTGLLLEQIGCLRTEIEALSQSNLNGVKPEKSRVHHQHTAVLAR